MYRLTASAFVLKMLLTVAFLACGATLLAIFGILHPIFFLGEIWKLIKLVFVFPIEFIIGFFKIVVMRQP